MIIDVFDGTLEPQWWLLNPDATTEVRLVQDSVELQESMKAAWRTTVQVRRREKADGHVGPWVEVPLVPDAEGCYLIHRLVDGEMRVHVRAFESALPTFHTWTRKEAP